MTEVAKTNFHNTQYFRKNNSSVDFKYICIRKEFFDVSMVSLNYKDLKKNNHIEIIYKSPSAFLEGLFFKTPKIKSQYISIIHKENNFNNIILKLSLNYHEHSQFINILRQIDEHLSSNLYNSAKDIEHVMLKQDNSETVEQTIQPLQPLQSSPKPLSLQSYRYEQLIRFKNHGETIEMTMKSYLDTDMVHELEKKMSNTAYILTFNISNIFLGNQSYMPLIKCNRCEKVI